MVVSRGDAAVAPSPARRARARRILLLSVWSGALALLALVGAASLLATSRARFRWDVISSGAPLMTRDPELGYVSSPGSTTHRRHRSGLEYSYHRDGRGGRVRSATPSIPSRAELLFVGGSFTAGRGVEYDQTFAAIVGRERGQSVENLGTGAYGTVQSLLLLERHADLSPEIVVYGFISDHIRRNLSSCAPSLLPRCMHVPHVGFDPEGAPFISPPGPGAEADWSRNERFYAAMLAPPFSWTSLVTGLDLLLDRARRRLAAPEAVPARDAAARRESMRYLMHRMSGVVERLGARLIVVYIPELRDADSLRQPPPPELTGALAPGTELVDLSRTLGAHTPEAALGIPGDGHPSAWGHREIARGILEHLARRGSVAGPRGEGGFGAGEPAARRAVEAPGQLP